MTTSMDVDPPSDGLYGGCRNRLGLQMSPYLIQHANDLVDWYSWGNEAFEKAREEKKLIFLSIGYSACHWCHLMQDESFKNNQEICDLLNKNFVCIKVDREERPDVDQVYMFFVQATQGGCGWPLSAWLTHDRKPIVGGTYFPPEDRYFGRPGFKNVLLQIIKAYEDDRKGVLNQGDEVLEELHKAIKFKIEKGSDLPSCSDVVKTCFTLMDKKYDPEYGGFGRAPKFPQPVYLEFMFRKYAADPETEEGKKAKEIGLESLRKMALGGIYDQIGKGFHRYSTDAEWHLPFFEKMLYDQAQLVMAYASAYQISKDEVFAKILKEILIYVNGCLKDKEGGFYSAEDSDSFPPNEPNVKREGAFYVWTYGDLKKNLDEPVAGTDQVTDGDVFIFHYDCQEHGNIEPFKDPHAELAHQNVLIIRGDMKKTAEKFSLSVEDTEQILEKARKKLSDLRQTRTRPLLDRKIVTSWNGLMISGFARAAQVLDDEDCRNSALQAIEFLYVNAFQPEDGHLVRNFYFDTSANKMVIGPNPIPGFAEDYSMLINGLLDTYEACFDDRLLEFAERFQKIQDRLFWDDNDYGYFRTSKGNESEIVMRLKDSEDGDEPCSNSLSCRNLLRLAMFLGEKAYRDRAVQVMTSFGNRLLNMPMAVSEMVGALMFHCAKPKQIIICGELDSDETKAFIRCINSRFLPNKVVIVNHSKAAFLRERVKALSSMKYDDKATVYICEDFDPKQQLTTVESLETVLN